MKKQDLKLDIHCLITYLGDKMDLYHLQIKNEKELRKQIFEEKKYHKDVFVGYNLGKLETIKFVMRELIGIMENIKSDNLEDLKPILENKDRD
jgi:hypothetical protein